MYDKLYISILTIFSVCLTDEHQSTAAKMLNAKGVHMLLTLLNPPLVVKQRGRQRAAAAFLAPLQCRSALWEISMEKSEWTHPIKLQEASNKPRQEQHGKRMSA